MPTTRIGRSVARIRAGIFAIGLTVITSGVSAREAPTRISAAVYPLVVPPNRNLDASLYAQTATESRACYYQAYNLAIARLKEGIAKPPLGKPLAVVMDLDETVFDNSRFRSTLVRNGLDYDDRLWDRWQERGFDKVGLMPGAKSFIDEANNNGVAVIFVSNRDEKYRAQTKKIFERLGIPIIDDTRLKLKKSETDSDDKTSRFNEAERDYTVLLYVGDSLRDFTDIFRFNIPSNATGDDLDRLISARKQLVDESSATFGQKWIILPNPVYGEWIAPLERGYDDVNRLNPAVPEILPARLSVAANSATRMTTSMVILLCVGSFVGGIVLVLLVRKLVVRRV
jgi:5'-nucleotidase (lipoprotein e(P4) family)